MFKGIVAATASIGLMATPAMAAGTAAQAAVPSTEVVAGLQQGDEGTGPNWAIIIAAIVAVGLGIWAAVSKGHDHPASP